MPKPHISKKTGNAIHSSDAMRKPSLQQVNHVFDEGSIIRYEKGLFQSYFACGDKEIEEMYRNFKHNEKQNVYLMTNTMTKEEIMPHFNTDIYNVLMSDSFK